MKRLYASLLVVLIISGCIAIPFGDSPKQSRSDEFVANNMANMTYTFEVFVVEKPANVTIQRSDGKVDTDSISAGVTYFDPGENHTYTAVEVPDTARLHGRFTLSPGESNQTSIKDHPRHFMLVIPVYRDENEIIGYVTATGCEYKDKRTSAKLRVTIRSGEYPLHVTHTCV